MATKHELKKFIEKYTIGDTNYSLRTENNNISIFKIFLSQRKIQKIRKILR